MISKQQQIRELLPTTPVSINKTPATIIKEITFTLSLSPGENASLQTQQAPSWNWGTKVRVRVAEVGSLSSKAKMAIQIFVKRIFTIFATNASF